jgi:predicted RNA-binding Zn-ribbon protein involved in translation (DUF1610 family)
MARTSNCSKRRVFINFVETTKSWRDVPGVPIVTAYTHFHCPNKYWRHVPSVPIVTAYTHFHCPNKSWSHVPGVPIVTAYTHFHCPNKSWRDVPGVLILTMYTHFHCPNISNIMLGVATVWVYLNKHDFSGVHSTRLQLNYLYHSERFLYFVHYN